MAQLAGSWNWAGLFPSRYRYFIFLNSSNRGPFMPAYWPKASHWSAVLTSRLNSLVKLVGPTISCEGGSDADSWNGPHVQSYIMATDQVGLKLLMNDEGVFACHQDISNTIKYSEIGASSVIMNAGYSIDSLMRRYQGIDWRDEANWNCNARASPYGDPFYDGIALEATEVMFVKVKERFVDLRWTYAVNAKRYDAWLTDADEKGARDVSGNEWQGMGDELKMPKILMRMAQGDTCFDHVFYRKANEDLPPLELPGLWQHFVVFGQHEGRPFRYMCQPKVLTGLEAFAAGQTLPAAVAAAVADVASATPASSVPAQRHLLEWDEFAQIEQVPSLAEAS
ncbi:hypothetical protein WJX84_010796 [Apatococcus fuscideae]|uniref:Uncharacterized protein n=1 Tax=Apatococcus fuscideae TaxID=2026836 RepID=A0AAW1SYE4_9CHLO